jgi:hypothetical protein
VAFCAVARRLSLINFIDLAFSAVRVRHVGNAKNAIEFSSGIQKGVYDHHRPNWFDYMVMKYDYCLNAYLNSMALLVLRILSRVPDKIPNESHFFDFLTC